MNPLIKSQLEKLNSEEILSRAEDSNLITITKGELKLSQGLCEDKCYLISVEDYILNPPDGFTLHTNWNNNRIPKDKVMKIDVLKKMGKMIRVNAIGFDLKNGVDTSNMWEGWLPEKSIKIIEQL